MPKDTEDKSPFNLFTTTDKTTADPAEEIERDTIAELEKMLEVRRRVRQPFESKWYKNIAYWMGKQWVLYDSKNRSMRTPPVPSWRVRLVINMIYPGVRIILGKLNKVIVQLSCVPKSQEFEDVAGARTGTKVLKYLQKKLKDMYNQFQITLIMCLMGVGYLKTYWNSEANEEVVFDEVVPDPTPENPQNTKMVKKTMHLGELESAVRSPMDLFFDETLPINIQDNHSIFDIALRTTGYVKEKYGIEVQSDNTIYVSTIQAQLDTLMDKTNVASKTDLVMVKEYWEKPNGEHKKGRHIIYAGTEILFLEDKMPYKDYPYVDFPYFPTIGNCYPPAPVEMALPLNKEYNKSRSQIIEHKNLMSKGKWLIPEGCKVSRNAFTSEPGEKVYYDARYGKPEQVPIQPMPNYIWDNVTYIRNELNDVLGIHDVSQAKVPSGIRSGLAISFLQEQDDSQLGITFSLIQDSWARVGHQRLEIIKEYYQEKRIIRITGRENESDAFYFKGEDLRGNTDVDVEIGSMMPFSKVARQDFVMSLWREKIIQDPAKVMKLLEFSTEEEVMESDKLDEANASLENMDMSQSRISHLAQVWDNHAVHLQSHNYFRKDRKFTEFPQEVQKMFEIHIKGHQDFIDVATQKQMLQQSQMMAMQEQAKAGGQPPQQ